MPPRSNLDSLSACPGCARSAEADGWCRTCAPLCVRVGRCIADLHAARRRGCDVSSGSVAFLFARLRHLIDEDQAAAVVLGLRPKAPPAPMMPRVGVVMARRVGVVGPWCPASTPDRMRQAAA